VQAQGERHTAIVVLRRARYHHALRVLYADDVDDLADLIGVDIVRCQAVGMAFASLWDSDSRHPPFPGNRPAALVSPLTERSAPAESVRFRLTWSQNSGERVGLGLRGSFTRTWD